MGCLMAFLGRLALLLVWVTTPLVNRAFQGGWILPLLGIIFLPFTALSYVLVYALANGVSGGAWLWVVLGFFFDVAAHSATAYTNRHRIVRTRNA